MSTTKSVTRAASILSFLCSCHTSDRRQVTLQLDNGRVIATLDGTVSYTFGPSFDVEAVKRILASAEMGLAIKVLADRAAGMSTVAYLRKAILADTYSVGQCILTWEALDTMGADEIDAVKAAIEEYGLIPSTDCDGLTMAYPEPAYAQDSRDRW